MTERPTTSAPWLKKILGGIGVTSIIGLISFLGTIFMTQAAFSSWCTLNFYPRNNQQDISISKNEQRILNIDKTLVQMENNQKEIIRLILKSR